MSLIININLYININLRKHLYILYQNRIYSKSLNKSDINKSLNFIYVIHILKLNCLSSYGLHVCLYKERYPKPHYESA